MNKSKKKLLVLLVFVIALLVISGCKGAPVDANKKIIQITTETTFNEIFKNESWFSALFVFPLAQAINKTAPTLGIAGAIAIVTVAVNLIILLFTFKSTIQGQQMQLIQPELDKIAKKYEGKKDQTSQMKQAQETQQLFQKYNINPFGTIIALFLQFPIIIAMFQSVQRAEAVSNGKFLGTSLSIAPLDGFLAGNYTYLILFVIMILVQLLSMMLPQLLAKQRAKKEAELHHKKVQKPNNPNQNMMYFMMIPILLLSIKWPSAMTIYWIINSIVTIFKTLLIQKIIENKKVGVN